MKKLCAFTVLTAMLFLLGCNNSELVNCQQENQSLQSNISLMQQELAAAKSAVEKKDKTIEDLRSENVQMQTKAMESIRTMMERQAAKDQEIKDKLAAAQQQNSELQKQLEQLKAELNQARQQPSPAAPAAEQPAAVQ